MCGILGFSHAIRKLPPGTLDSAISSLVHRGPDQQGRLSFRQISLAATRLRVLDLEGGDQPLRSADGDVTLVFNGEILNYRQLRLELEGQGVRFSTQSDSEVVLQAFMHWGKSCFALMRGMFAIALWEESTCRLTLVRDPMGIKPLYYYRYGEEIFFASEMKCILAHPGVPRILDLAGLDCFLSLNYVPAPRTLIDGIHKLTPGQMLEWSRGRVSMESIPFAEEGHAVPASIEAACEELDSHLKHAVAESLLSDVPVGVWLSGGLDSSTLLHYAAAASDRPLDTFSVTFAGRSFDDGGYTREVSSHYGTRHHELDLSPSLDFTDAIGEFAYYSDEPCCDAGALPVWYLAKMTRRKVTVSLSGEGADELFGGYLTYRADRYRHSVEWVPAWLKRLALAGAIRVPVSDEKIGFGYKLRRFLEGTLLSREEAHTFWNGTFSGDEKRNLLRMQNPPGLAFILAGMQQGYGLERYLQFDQRYFLPDNILNKVDRMSMAHALEVRPPFLDPRIVAFAARLPENMKLRGRSSKHVLRRLMTGKLPPHVLSRPKIGLDIPIHEWFRGPLRPLLLDSLSEEAVRGNGLFRWGGVRKLIDSHLNRKANVGYHLWGLMTLLLWMKRWGVECPMEPAARHGGAPLLEEEVGWLHL